jgi:hypothetical protein
LSGLAMRRGEDAKSDTEQGSRKPHLPHGIALAPVFAYRPKWGSSQDVSWKCHEKANPARQLTMFPSPRRAIGPVY